MLVMGLVNIHSGWFITDNLFTLASSTNIQQMSPSSSHQHPNVTNIIVTQPNWTDSIWFNWNFHRNKNFYGRLVKFKKLIFPSVTLNHLLKLKNSKTLKNFRFRSRRAKRLLGQLRSIGLGLKVNFRFGSSVFCDTLRNTSFLFPCRHLYSDPSPTVIRTVIYGSIKPNFDVKCTF